MDELELKTQAGRWAWLLNGGVVERSPFMYKIVKGVLHECLIGYADYRVSSDNLIGDGYKKVIKPKWHDNIPPEGVLIKNKATGNYMVVKDRLGYEIENWEPVTLEEAKKLIWREKI